jgi:2-phospho-L-lactate guanylyltransferase
VKRLSESKTRLSPALSLKERERLVGMMLVDVLNAVSHSKMVSRTIIVSPDNTVLKGLYSRNVEIIGEENGRGLNVALKHAVVYSLRNGATSLLVLPADIPLITKNDIEQIIASSSDDGIVIVPSEDGLGTNALALTPPDVISTAFGSNSFQSHLNLAQIRGIPAKVLKIERVSLDIDTTDHVEEFLSFPTQTNTRDYLLAFQLRRQLERS